MPTEPLIVDSGGYGTEDVIIDNVGCIFVINYDYDALTLELIDAYTRAYIPLPEIVYKAYDSIFRQLKIVSGVKETYADDFTITDNGSGEPTLVYSRPDLIDSEIIEVTVEGQGIPGMVVNINLSTGIVTFPYGFLTVSQFVKIIYKKVPTI